MDGEEEEEGEEEKEEDMTGEENTWMVAAGRTR